MSKEVLYTIGHSTRTFSEFAELLDSHGVELLVDVRTVPRSRHTLQFNEEELAASLKKRGIEYLHLADLGGLRHAKKESTNTGWRNASFRGYADYMQTPEFERGLTKLMEKAREKPTAIMCAEAVPWRCHRSLIADALIVAGWTVRDIMTKRTAPLHKQTPFLVTSDGRLSYPPPSGPLL